MRIEEVVNFDKSFMDMVTSVVADGNRKVDRTGVGTFSQMGHAMRFDISDGKVPLLTLRDTKPQNAIFENLWFLSGDTDVKFLKDNNVGIWDEWVIPETAVFRDYTEQEYVTQYKKLFTGKPEYGNGEDTEFNKYVVCTYRDGLNWIRCTEPDMYKAFVHKYPQGADRETLKNFLGNELGHGFKLSNKKLVSGSIGSGAYGAQWRNWEVTRLVAPTDIAKYLKMGYTEVARNMHHGSGVVVVTRNIDQYANVIDQLKNNPDSRRIIVNGWNVGKLEECQLPPCHLYHQYYTRELTYDELTERIIKRGYQVSQGVVYGELQAICKERSIPTRSLSLFLQCRSQDTILGTVSNVFQYAVLAHMVASVVGMETEHLVWTAVDAHVYNNHLDGVGEMIDRMNADGDQKQTARILINPDVKSIDNFKVSDIKLVNYKCNPVPIVFPIAV